MDGEKKMEGSEKEKSKRTYVNMDKWRQGMNVDSFLDR
jgi:hypothetical protein